MSKKHSLLLRGLGAWGPGISVPAGGALSLSPGSPFLGQGCLPLMAAMAVHVQLLSIGNLKPFPPFLLDGEVRTC